MFSYLNERTMPEGLMADNQAIGNTLRLGESGMHRFASIMGWLSGLSDAGYEHAANLADDFARSIVYLSNFGGADVTQRVGDMERSAPGVITVLSDDGTKHGFGVLWYKFVKFHENTFDATRDIESRKLERQPYVEGNYPVREYEFMMNGGLIFHGPKTAEEMAKWEPRNYFCWCVHT